MKPIRWAAALAAVALCLPGVALAQKKVGSPANTVPQVALCVGDVGQPCIPLTAADFGGGLGGGASEVTLVEAVGELQGLRGDLATPADSLPPQPPVASSDTTLTSFYLSSASADMTVATATASQSSRLHDLECSILPTSGTVTITIKSASTTLRAIDFPAAGGVLRWTYRPYWYAKTANNEALIISFSAGGAYKCAGLYVKGA